MPAEMNLGSITSSQIINNFVGNGDTSDSFAFSLSHSQNISLSLTGMSADADLRLFRARSLGGSIEAIETIAISDQASNQNEFINRVLEAGVYIAEVVQYSGNTNYRLAIAPNNAATTYNIGTLTSSHAFTGFVGDTNPTDTYRFNLTTTSNLNLALNGLSQDADIRIGFDANNNGTIDTGEVIGFSENFDNQSESISLQSRPAGNYLVEVYRYQAADTHYRLNISATAVANPQSNVDLVGQLGVIQAPDLRVPGDIGQAQMVVANQGGSSTNAPITVRLYASTDMTYDSNDELLDSVTLSGSLFAGQSQTLTFQFDAPTVVAPGSYYLLARIDADHRVAEWNETNNLLSAHVSAPGTNTIVDWDATMLNAIQKDGTAPPLAARNQAMVHTAMFDAVNAIARQYDPYLVEVNPNFAAGASANAAAAAAAHRILTTLYANQSAEFNAQLARSLAEIPDGFAETRGVEIGRLVADFILNNRANDGSSTAQFAYTPVNAPGAYQSTRADGFVLLPGWGNVTPFAIPSPDAIALEGIPAYGSAQYALELNQVQALGGINSIVRTADQTETAFFWAYDRPDTFRPPAQWNQIAQTIVIQEGTSLVETARLFALMNIAQADAGITAWDKKFEINQLRPETAIHQAGQDGNPQTIADPNWHSLLPNPPFPDYISGHSTFGAAAAGVLSAFFGDTYAFTATSQEIPGVYRSFDSFWQAAEENGTSRIVGGVHVQSANRDGLLAGYTIANYVVQNFLTANPVGSSSDPTEADATPDLPAEALMESVV